jgi:hypothetical protein
VLSFYRFLGLGTVPGRIGTIVVDEKTDWVAIESALLVDGLHPYLNTGEKCGEDASGRTGEGTDVGHHNRRTSDRGSRHAGRRLLSC